MESDKYICVCEISPQNSMVIIDMSMTNQPLVRPITADSSLMNPNIRILALKINAHEFKLENELLDREEHDDDDELRKLLLVNVEELFTVVEVNFTTYFTPDLMKPGHDQCINRHAKGLCVIGLDSTHVAFKDEGGIVSVNFIEGSLIGMKLK